MAKGTVVRGTPITHVGPNGDRTTGNGFNPQPLQGYSGTTTKDQFRGDQAQKIDPKSGTAYVSQASNPDNYLRTVSQGKYGVSPIAGGVDSNDPAGNGDGVVFDGVTEARGMRATPRPAMDSPVPVGAQAPAPDAPKVLANLRSGAGSAWSADQGPGNSFSPGGVMSRD